MKKHSFLQPVHPDNQTFIVVYGPPGSGKTLNAEKICLLLRCDTIADEGGMSDEDATYAHRILVLADTPSPRDPRPGRRRKFLPPYDAIPVEKIAEHLGPRWTQPKSRP